MIRWHDFKYNFEEMGTGNFPQKKTLFLKRSLNYLGTFPMSNRFRNVPDVQPVWERSRCPTGLGTFPMSNRFGNVSDVQPVWERFRCPTGLRTFPMSNRFGNVSDVQPVWERSRCPTGLGTFPMSNRFGNVSIMFWPISEQSVKITKYQ
jgi:hypothetical protein